MTEERRKPKDLIIDKDEWETISRKLGLRFFTEFPEDAKCAICKTNENMPCILVSIINTIDTKYNDAKALPVHIKCLHLFYYPPNVKEKIFYGMIIQRVNMK